MQPKKWNTLRCLLLLVLLAGCVPSPQLRPDLQQATRDPLVEQAEGYASSGDYVAAAELFTPKATGPAHAGKRQSPRYDDRCAGGDR